MGDGTESQGLGMEDPGRSTDLRTFNWVSQVPRDDPELALHTKYGNDFDRWSAVILSHSSGGVIRQLFE